MCAAFPQNGKKLPKSIVLDDGRHPQIMKLPSRAKCDQYRYRLPTGRKITMHDFQERWRHINSKNVVSPNGRTIKSCNYSTENKNEMDSLGRQKNGYSSFTGWKITIEDFSGAADAHKFQNVFSREKRS